MMNSQKAVNWTAQQEAPYARRANLEERGVLIVRRSDDQPSLKLRPDREDEAQRGRWTF